MAIFTHLLPLRRAVLADQRTYPGERGDSGSKIQALTTSGLCTETAGGGGRRTAAELNAMAASL